MTSSDELYELCEVGWSDNVEYKIPLSLSIFKVITYKQFQQTKLIQVVHRYIIITVTFIY